MYNLKFKKKIGDLQNRAIVVNMRATVLTIRYVTTDIRSELKKSLSITI